MGSQLSLQLFSEYVQHLDGIRDVVLPWCAQRFALIKATDGWAHCLKLEAQGHLPARAPIALQLLERL